MNQALKAAQQQRTTQQQVGTGGVAAGGNGNVVAKPKDPVADLMQKLTPQLKTALPSCLSAERVARVALTELRQNPKLADAALTNPISFGSAMLRAATLGFEVGNGLGHCYLLPFEKKRKDGNRWVTVSVETQLIIGYRGMIELARRSGQIESLYAVEVYDGEPCEIERGFVNTIRHKTLLGTPKKPENVIAVYAVAKLKGGEIQFDVMDREQIEAIRARSKSKDNGPWVTDWIEMAKKTVVRRLFKYLPVSIEVRSGNGASQAMALDTLASAEENTFQVDPNTGEVIFQQQEQQEASSSQPEMNASMEEHSESTNASVSNSFAEYFRQANSVAELDELHLQQEGSIDPAELDALNRAYRARRTEIEDGQGSLID